MNISIPYGTFAIAMVSLLLIACSPSESKQTNTTALSVPADTTKEYMDAPDFTLNTMSGDPFTLSDHEGKVVVINIWATWCAPCRKEIPDFMKMQREMRDQGVLFLGVSIDEEGWDAVRPYAQKMDINYPVVVDDGSVFDGYGPFRLIPTSYIINKRGQVEYVAPGMMTERKLKPILEKLANR
ncbi:TlpA disulfide reductase family protein [Fodinibius salsisoli]|uniref:TlpA family protein disulfide reductase n=1 Tax=Fodinibius salsisoli TaxID=2820877 RepID=A0ABT3PS49_9BACT|nr:TlpA disulfide reductase family protein [Fodinibius salsisoli]MCW9708688.1 TlpA family protein disulfide reductase [Fodinibius salsisoli]